MFTLTSSNLHIGVKSAPLKNCTDLHSLKHEEILNSTYRYLNAILLRTDKSRLLS